MKSTLLLFSIMPVFILCMTGGKNTTPTGNEIIEKMHEEKDGKWGRNMRFDQNVFLYRNDSLVKEEVWQEILSSPQNLQIRFNGFETGNGILFKNDSIYYFANEKLSRKEERVHHLLLMGFDVYFLPPYETQNKLKDLGFELDRSYEKNTEIGTVYVVGTNDPNDSRSSQFWINKEKPYLEKLALNRNGNISEVNMNNYQIIDSFPVATEIDFYTNGALYMVEKYFDVSFPENVDPAIFDPTNFAEMKW